MDFTITPYICFKSIAISYICLTYLKPAPSFYQKYAYKYPCFHLTYDISIDSKMDYHFVVLVLIIRIRVPDYIYTFFALSSFVDFHRKWQFTKTTQKIHSLLRKCPVRSIYRIMCCFIVRICFSQFINYVKQFILNRFFECYIFLFTHFVAYYLVYFVYHISFIFL